MEPAIEFEVVWQDQDVIECGVRCSNGSFCGWAKVYLSHDDLPRMADDLNGFPRQTKDTRYFEIGAFNPQHAYGGIRMRFYCLDSVGHVGVEVKLRGHGCEALGEPESVALRIPIEAAAIDSFVKQLKGMESAQIGTTACLYRAS